MRQGSTLACGTTRRNAEILLLACLLASCASRRTSERMAPRYSLEPAERQMLIAALDKVIELTVDSAAAAVCITSKQSTSAQWRAEAADLSERLASPVSIVREALCPPTYARMIVYVDSLGRSDAPVRPQGYHDPYRIDVLEFATRRDSGSITIRVLHGMGGRDYICLVAAVPHRWTADCRSERRWVSYNAMQDRRGHAAWQPADREVRWGKPVSGIDFGVASLR